MRLSKAGVVAVNELGRLIRSKVFLLSVALVPLLSGALVHLQSVLRSRPDLKVRRVAVWDPSGAHFEDLERAAAGRSGARFVPVRFGRLGQGAEQRRAEALERVGRQEFFAYLEIPYDLEKDGLRYYSDTPTYDELRAWLEAALNDQLRLRRYRALGVDAAKVWQAEARNRLPGFALLEPGRVGPVGLPMLVTPAGAMLLLFLLVMLTAPQMMSSVLEEKTSRVSEVLLSSVTPFELMLGKLAACCGAAVVVGVLYLGLGLGLAAGYGYSGLLSLEQAAAFLGFLVLAVFLHGSLAMAVGAACSQPREAQGLLAPLVLVTLAPLAALGALLQDPGGRLAVALSYFPLSAPFIMAFRVLGRPRPPLVELMLSVLITLTATLFCVWAASRVFRIGLLAQGKAPDFRQLFRWIFMR